MSAGRAVKAVAPAASSISGFVFHVSALSGRSFAVRPYAAVAFRASHRASFWHSECEVEIDWLPTAIREHFSGSLFGHQSCP
jgi:hypothetical protein